MVIKLSGVILTKNEEKNIERTLQSVRFCHEIIVIDDYSEDKTIEKVSKVLKVYPLSHKATKEHGKVCKVFRRHLSGDFAAQRNFGLEKSGGEWVLFVDGDEEVTDKLKEEIMGIVNNSLITKMQEKDAYYIKRRDIWWGRELRFGEIRKIRQTGLIRLIKKNSGKWAGKIHEVFKTTSEIGKLQSYLIHRPHPTIKEFLSEINFYSTLRAKELSQQNKKTNILEIVLYPFGKFILTYFIKLGFLDGPEGFIYAFMMSFHSFLVRAKLYLEINVKLDTNITQ